MNRNEQGVSGRTKSSGHCEDAPAARQAGTDILQIDAGLSRDRSSLAQRIAQIDSQTGQTTAARGHVVRAPQAGRVAALRARTGEQAEPRAPLALSSPARL